MVTYSIPLTTILPSTRVNPNEISSNADIPQMIVNDRIRSFYDGAVIFITGATGFVGKALLEKLLRTCTGINHVYILIRPKRGHGVEQRCKELLKNPVFDRIREKTPEYLNKVKAVYGDVSHPNLGLCDVDRQVLISSVNIVFHSAATVRFNENLKEAVILNTIGTKRMIKLCKEMKKLMSFVHVSTAYSNADKRNVDEIVYDPPFDTETIIKCVETLSTDTINTIAEKIQGKHPNTYTMTKAMAEYIISQNSSEFPTAIVRPSIVTAAWKEPFQGWLDNLTGISGIMMEIGRGTIRSIICEEEFIIDVIPVDVLVSTLITAAWHNVVHRSNTVRVYNCTSGQVNGIKWKHFGELTLKHALNYPSKYVTWYPHFKFRTNQLVHFFCHYLLHFAPAAFLDVILYCTKHKPIMLRICNKFATACKQGSFFATNMWVFKNNNFRELIETVRKTEDGIDFLNCDMTVEESDFSWDKYVKNYMLGIRRYVLKDDESTLETAKLKLKRLLWCKRIIQLISVLIFLKFVFRF